MKNILVLGANGFLGSHFCKILNKRNYKIFPVVRYSSNLKRFRKLNCCWKSCKRSQKDYQHAKKLNFFVRTSFLTYFLLVKVDIWGPRGAFPATSPPPRGPFGPLFFKIDGKQCF